jgi:tRNA 2-thiocytidine biosynthesis protein TtcA
MIRDWQKKFPGRIENMFSALQNVVPSHLMDAKLHDFKNLKITGLPSDDGDKAFDDESFEAPNVTASLQGVQVVQL